MPAGWVSAGIGAIGLYNSMTADKGGGGSGNTQGGYVPYNRAGVDQNWNYGYQQQLSAANETMGQGYDRYAQTLANNDAINYNPYMQNQQQVGQQYGNLANTAQQQMGGYQDAANTASGQQHQLYGAGQQLWNTAQDPQNALYARTQGQLQDQVRAGQAARGLGNSAVGAGEENQAMSNFNIDWQNQQLQRQMTGLQGMSQASNAGGAQGQLYGADMSGALAAGGAGAGYMSQAGTIPLTAQQYVAGQPAANANQFAQGMNTIQGAYSNPMSQAMGYMNAGNGVQQFNTQFGANQNAANTQALLTGAKGLVNSYNTPGSWLNNTFGGGSSGGSSGGGSSSSTPTGGYTDYSNGYTGGYDSGMNWTF